jgi:hypothetical protein
MLSTHGTNVLFFPVFRVCRSSVPWPPRLPHPRVSAHGRCRPTAHPADTFPGRIVFTSTMAVRLTEDALCAAVKPEVFDTAREMFLAGRVGEITERWGGATACVGVREEGTTPLDVWVGIVDSELEAECGCGADPDADLCPHAVALTLAAVDAGFTWRPSSIPLADLGQRTPSA